MNDDSRFAQNLTTLYVASNFKTREVFANTVQINRTTISRLINGTRQPTERHKILIAQCFGIEPNDLLLPKNEFKGLITRTIIKTDLAMYSLKITKDSLKHCDSIFEKYKGTFKMFSQRYKQGGANVSLLSIDRVTKNGIAFRLINPYKTSNGDYTAFVYKGYFIQIAEYLYFFGEQIDGAYEVLTMVFHTTPLKKAQILEGIICGIGVYEDRKLISAVPAIALPTKHDTNKWEDSVGKELGHLPESKLPEVVRKKLHSNFINV